MHYHERHQKIAGDWFLQAWFLLMNGVFLFMAQKFGLGNLQDLLVLVASLESPPPPPQFLSVSLRKNISSSGNMIGEQVWNLWLSMVIWLFHQ